MIIVVVTAAWVTAHNYHSQWIRRCEEGREGRSLFLLHTLQLVSQKESTAETEHQTLTFNPPRPCPALSSDLSSYRLRLLSELTILTWKKISNKDICDPIKQLGPHSPGAPPGIYCYGNDVICKLTSSSARGDFSNDIIDQESFSTHLNSKHFMASLLFMSM